MYRAAGSAANPYTTASGRRGRVDGALLGAQGRKWFVPEHVEAREDPDDGNQDGGQDDAAEVLPRKDAPRDLERVAAHAPRERDGADRSDEAGQRPEDA